MNYQALKVSDLRRLVRKRGLASGLIVAGARKDVLVQALTLGHWPLSSIVESGGKVDGDLVSAYLESLELAKASDRSERFYLLQGRIVSALAGLKGGGHD